MYQLTPVSDIYVFERFLDALGHRTKLCHIDMISPIEQLLAFADAAYVSELSIWESLNIAAPEEGQLVSVGELCKYISARFQRITLSNTHNVVGDARANSLASLFQQITESSRPVNRETELKDIEQDALLRFIRRIQWSLEKDQGLHWSGSCSRRPRTRVMWLTLGTFAAMPMLLHGLSEMHMNAGGWRKVVNAAPYVLLAYLVVSEIFYPLWSDDLSICVENARTFGELEHLLWKSLK